MQGVLNMKRIGLYGRDAADDPDNGLYAVWAQEAAHRWLVYFRLRREPPTAANSEALLGRMYAHWKNNVQADGSIIDGYAWNDNGDGTFTPRSAASATARSINTAWGCARPARCRPSSCSSR